MAVYESIRKTGIQFVGFKDIGLPMDQLVDLTKAIKRDQRTVMLEVVSTTIESELASIEAGAKLGVDYVMGGRHAKEAVEILRGREIQYFPFAGQTVGHPTRLVGSLEEIADDARSLASIPGVHGLDLLAYRYQGDVPRLTRAVVRAAGIPIVTAGSIDSPERIQAMKEAGAWGFTVGSALFDGAFAEPAVRGQIETILQLEGVSA